jgi:hypothetical protein
MMRETTWVHVPTATTTRNDAATHSQNHSTKAQDFPSRTQQRSNVSGYFNSNNNTGSPHPHPHRESSGSSLPGPGSVQRPIMARTTTTTAEALPPAVARPSTSSSAASTTTSLWERPSTSNGRQRRLSNSSDGSTTTVASSMSMMSGESSVGGRRRSSSFSSQTSFESTFGNGGVGSMAGSPASAASFAQYQHSLQQRGGGDGQFSWARPAPIKPAYRRWAKPGQIFASLPGEVLELILEFLRDLHLGSGSTSCATCWMRDCCAVALSARKFLKYARVALYENVQLIGVDGPAMKKRTKLGFGARMTLLRRTLRASLPIAMIVRTLKPPFLPPGVEADEYHDLLASVIMACPNFERLVGFYPTYNHAFSRLFQALFTRPRLKEMNWMLEASPFQRQRRILTSANNMPYNNGTNASKLLAPGDLQPFQSANFLDFHVNWHHLTSLSIHCAPGATLTPDTLLESTIHHLRSLRELHLSHLPYAAFSDSNLLALPPLKTLSLSHCCGVTTAGLSSFATRSTSASLTALTLVQLNIDSLPALARMFSNLASLQTFNLVQSSAPVMPADEMIWLFPYLASTSLRQLHWDVPEFGSYASPADSIMAKSIVAHGFPELRQLRTPNDPDGIFQSLCRPVERIDTPSDRYRGGLLARQPKQHDGILDSRNRPGGDFSRGHHAHQDSVASSASRGSGNSSRKGSLAGMTGVVDSTPIGPLIPLRDHSHLHQARVLAQGRLEAARRLPRYFVNVIDEDGRLVEKYGIGAFLGAVESKINYHLLPDPGASDEQGGLVGIQELVGDCGEDLVAKAAKLSMKDEKDNKKAEKSNKTAKKTGDANEELMVREGCSGRWNMYTGPTVDKKDRDRWAHVERGRWKGVTLA